MIEATAERYFGEMCRYFKKQDKENIGQLMFSSLVEEFKSCVRSIHLLNPQVDF